MHHSIDLIRHIMFQICEQVTIEEKDGNLNLIFGVLYVLNQYWNNSSNTIQKKNKNIYIYNSFSRYVHKIIHKSSYSLSRLYTTIATLAFRKSERKDTPFRNQLPRCEFYGERNSK